jgi:hypothetical protein
LIVCRFRLRPFMDKLIPWRARVCPVSFRSMRLLLPPRQSQTVSPLQIKNWNKINLFFCSKDFESYQVCAFLYRTHDISNKSSTNKENPLIIHPPNFMFNIIPSIKSVKPEKTWRNYPFHLLSPLDSLLILCYFSLIRSHIDTLVGF